MFYLGLDLGSSSIKAALINAKTHNNIGIVQYPEVEMAIMSTEPNWAEQFPNIWWKNTKEVLELLYKKTGVPLSEIEGVGISYQMHGLVLVDEHQEALRPSIIWCDSRAVDIGNRLFEQFGRERSQEHLLNSPGNFTFSKLVWVKENEPEIFSKIHKMMLPGDFIAMKLTGKIATTKSGLSEGMMWDFKNDQPAYWMFDEMGIDTALIPDIVETFSNQGEISEKTAKEIGLKAGIPVCYRAGDQPNNALSLNVLESGDIAATGGTSGVVYAVTDSAKTKESLRINSFAHVNYSKEKPLVGKLLNINGAGILYSWMRREVGKNCPYLEMNELADNVPIGSEGLVILPFGNGAERMLNNQSFGSTMRHLNFNLHSNGHLFRAALEGIAFSFVYGMGILKDDGVDLKIIKAGNDNLFRSQIFSETIATLVDAEIHIVDTTSAVGAARAAAFGNGMYNSLRDALNTNKLVKTYKPQENKQEYLNAYNLWLKELNEIYK